jgi:hypothetical protein
MSDDPFDYLGSGSNDKPRATNGGQQTPKELPYSPPVGPKGQSHASPGLGGDNHGCCGTQGKH